MTNRSSRGSEQPAKAVALRRSINDRALICELHQGQRSCGRTTRPNTWLPPTKASEAQNHLATQGPSTQGLPRNSCCKALPDIAPNGLHAMEGSKLCSVDLSRRFAFGL